MLGRTNTGGGGTSLNFQVIDGTTEPRNPKENAIWVNTGTAITSWVFSATQPAGSAGTVWFSTGTSSAVKFNALKKNGIQIYPISAKQYVSGAWVDVEAKIYQNGEWNALMQYLYENGNTYDEVTGGWGHTKYASDFSGEASVAFETNRIKVTSSSSTSYITFVHTKTKVNVTDISQIFVKLETVKSFYNKMLIIDDGTSGNTPVAKIMFTGDSAELDVRTYSGIYYIGVVFSNTYVQARDAEEYITEVGYA